MEVKTRNLNVYVVEDSKSFSSWIKEELDHFDGITTKLLGGRIKEAEERILQDKPEVIVLDIRLENGTGLDVLRSIRREGIQSKVVIFTNYPWQVFQKQCMDLGADYFFDKSADSIQFLKSIKDIQVDGGTGNIRDARTILI